MTDSRDQPVTLARVPSGIPGLDKILRGGFLSGGVFVVDGAPGTGKTILANQMAFAHTANGDGRALFITLLAESHARMMQHMDALSFFDRRRVPDGIVYLSGFHTLEDGGLNGFAKLVRAEMKKRKPTLVVLDGLVTLADSSPSPREFRKFVYELQAYAALEGCVVLLLTSEGVADRRPEHTIVDGVLELEQCRVGMNTQRVLQVRKFRGSDVLLGQHTFRITQDGIVVFPRMEGLLANPSGEAEIRDDYISTGVETLDAMLGGGLPYGTTTCVVGPTGTGKTTLGLHFLAGSSGDEPGLHFGFYETPQRLLKKARGIGLSLESLLEQGHLEIIWHPPTEPHLDEIGDRLLQAVARRGVTRLFVDGLAAYYEATADAERITNFFTALTNEFRARGVTTVYTSGTPEVIRSEVTAPPTGIATVLDNLIVLRFVEFRAELHRVLSIVKVGESDFDSKLREFKITSAGIRLSAGFESAEALLSGFARERASATLGAGNGPPPG